MPSQTLPAPASAPVERTFADCRIYERKECDLPASCQVASVLEMSEMRWAATIGPETEKYVTTLMENRPHPEQGFRAALGIIRLAKQYGNDRIEATPGFIAPVFKQARSSFDWKIKNYCLTQRS